MNKKNMSVTFAVFAVTCHGLIANAMPTRQCWAFPLAAPILVSGNRTEPVDLIDTLTLISQRSPVAVNLEIITGPDSHAGSPFVLTNMALGQGVRPLGDVLSEIRRASAAVSFSNTHTDVIVRLRDPKSANDPFGRLVVGSGVGTHNADGWLNWIARHCSTLQVDAGMCTNFITRSDDKQITLDVASGSTVADILDEVADCTRSRWIAYASPPTTAYFKDTPAPVPSVGMTHIQVLFLSRLAPAPNRPTATAAYAAGSVCNEIYISWSPSAEADGYAIFRGSQSGEESATPISRKPVTGTTFIDSKLSANSTYYYEVAAINAAGTGPTSAEVYVTTAPAAPVGLDASVADYSASVSWKATAGASTYRIYRGTAKGSETYTAWSGTNSYTDSDSGVPGTTYFYKVSAVSSTGIEGPKSVEAVAAATTPVTETDGHDK